MVHLANNVAFTLVQTSHPGNIGATARAIKNMGFNQLRLVAPRYFPDETALARASGADDILAAAQVTKTLKEAIADCHVIYGTSSRARALQWPLLSLKESVEKMKSDLTAGNRIAILFGSERMGLTNEELAACHYHIYIPANPEFPSLNLAAAVQVVAYELHCQLATETSLSPPIPTKVAAEDMESFYRHLEQTLIALHFLDPENPRQMMRKLRRLFNRALLEPNELNILRGILTMIEKQSKSA